MRAARARTGWVCRPWCGEFPALDSSTTARSRTVPRQQKQFLAFESAFFFPFSYAANCFGLSLVWLMCSNRMGHYATMATRIRRLAFEKTLALGDRRRADSLLRDVLFRLRLGPRLPHGARPAV